MSEEETYTCIRCGKTDDPYETDHQFVGFHVYCLTQQEIEHAEKEGDWVSPVEKQEGLLDWLDPAEEPVCLRCAMSPDRRIAVVWEDGGMMNSMVLTLDEYQELASGKEKAIAGLVANPYEHVVLVSVHDDCLTPEEEAIDDDFVAYAEACEAVQPDENMGVSEIEQELINALYLNDPRSGRKWHEK